MAARQARYSFGVAVAAILAIVAGPANAELQRITIGTNPSGSVYFLLGSGFAKLFQEKLNVRATAQPHAGSSVYIPLIDQGEMTLGLNSTLDAALAYNGRDPFKTATKSVRSLARIWILPYGYMVRARSGLKSIEDLKGKRVVVNIKTNVSLEQLNKTILQTAGLSERDVTSVDSGGVVKSIDMVVEGQVDAVPVALPMPALSKAHASVPGGIRIIALGAMATDESMDKGTQGSRTYVAQPDKARPFITEAVRVAAFDSMLTAGTMLATEDAYRLTKTLHENWTALQKDYAPIRNVKPEEMAPATSPLPYHPGAIKYYKEVGLWTAANDKHQAALK